MNKLEKNKKRDPTQLWNNEDEPIQPPGKGRFRRLPTPPRPISSTAPAMPPTPFYPLKLSSNLSEFKSNQTPTECSASRPNQRGRRSVGKSRPTYRPRKTPPFQRTSSSVLYRCSINTSSSSAPEERP
ncbi:hypothetical protein BDV98DRAFT_565892 [Pterulicium gracile]|uniref:Uncharacterized protein n=1 Tax=Pterulicium gracile TaxID=1884261 RepID=A0A5C3QL34_9AGAR|nr:hypothetical protein BDV98DRAFT_565892 [Pterula gracilis]